MPIITPDEVINLLDNPDLDSKIGVIGEHIPIFQDKFVRRTNNYFHSENWVRSNDVEFQEEGVILDPSNVYLDDGVAFAAGMDFHVFGSALNDRIYLAETVVAGQIDVDEQWESIVNEDFGRTIDIFRIHWPPALKLLVARAIEFDLQQTAGAVERTTSKDDFSEYPEGIANELKSWRVTRTVY